MSRYLTPAKVGLLALVSLYADSVVPTPATIPILSFIVGHLIPLTTSSRSGTSINFILSIKGFQEACAGHASGIPGRTVWDLWLNKIWNVASLDALHLFFDNLSSIVAKSSEELQKDAADGRLPPSDHGILLSRTSPLGTFVRRSQLEFIRLQFHDAVGLWNSLISYRQPTWAAWRKRNPLASQDRFDINLDRTQFGGRLMAAAYGPMLHLENPNEGQVSIDDVVRLLDFQVEEMQKVGNRIPDEIKTQFQRMLDSDVMTPSLSHYVSFLDSWRAGDYPSAFDHLHRYFDYTMQNRDRTFYQYALLNLAILQADFGCYHEAVAAMQETISAARENKDMGCLNFSLSWLYHFGKAHPTKVSRVGKKGTMTVEMEGLAFLKAKAKETGMWSLWSTSLLSEAKLGLANGENVAAAFENIVKSSHLNVIKGMTNVVGSQMLLQSSLWNRLGVNLLSWSYCEIFLQCYAEDAPLDDILKCVCRGAYMLVLRGRYDEAMARMEQVDRETLRVLRNYRHWSIFAGILKLKRELHRNHLPAADRILSQLRAQELTESDIAFEVAVLELELLIRRRSYSLALSKVEALASKLNDDDAEILSRVRLLSIKAWLLSLCGVPLKGFSIAVRAASVAWRARLLPELWTALSAVTNVLVHLGEFDAAARILNAIMPQVLECEESALAARCYSIQVDAQMGLAGLASSGSIKRKEHLAQAIESIEVAFDEYSSIADINGQCEMIAKKAVILRLMGDQALSDDCSAKYLNLKAEWRKEME